MTGIGLCKILFIAPSSSVHTKKWCDWFSAKGCEVHVATLDSEMIPGATVHLMHQSSGPASSDFRKLTYLSCASELSRIIQSIQPDIIHAHYASSYGVLAALVVRQPYFLSIWGSDVYDFPRKSLLHRILLQYALRRATWLMSTSNAMATEASRYIDRAFVITPFGVDTDCFYPRNQSPASSDGFVVGTVKALSPKYGISSLLRGCALAIEKDPAMPLYIRIAGKGSQEQDLKRLAIKLGIAERIEWLGFVDISRVPDVWRSLDVALIPSESESFGVSAVEAMACGIPVVITDIPGLMEATCPRARVVVPRSNPDAIANALLELYRNPELRHILGSEGREFVCAHLSLQACFETVEHSYLSALHGENNA